MKLFVFIFLLAMPVLGQFAPLSFPPTPETDNQQAIQSLPPGVVERTNTPEHFITITLTWNQSGGDWFVQECTNLLFTNWFKIYETNSLHPNYTFTVTNDTPCKFFRIGMDI